MQFIDDEAKNCNNVCAEKFNLLPHSNNSDAENRNIMLTKQSLILHKTETSYYSVYFLFWISSYFPLGWRKAHSIQIDAILFSSAAQWRSLNSL